MLGYTLLENAPVATVHPRAIGEEGGYGLLGEDHQAEEDLVGRSR